jgi:hypothetical protein
MWNALQLKSNVRVNPEKSLTTPLKGWLNLTALMQMGSGEHATRFRAPPEGILLNRIDSLDLLFDSRK